MVKFIRGIWSLSLVALLAVGARCDEVVVEDAPAAPATAAQAPDELKEKELEGFELSAEAALKVKVSFEVRRKRLGEILTDLQQQSGIELASGAGSPAETASVTARVQDLPLYEVMGGFSRLYGVTWTRRGHNSYVMNRSKLGEIESELLRLGDPQEMQILTDSKGIGRREGLADEILARVDETALRTAGGVPFSKLPEDLRKKLQKILEETAAYRLVSLYHRASEPVINDYLLRIAMPPGPLPPGVLPSPGPQVAVKIGAGSEGFFLGQLYLPTHKDGNER